MTQPSLRANHSGGQKPVKADWIRLSAMKQVNSSHQEFTKCARATLINTMTPARTRMKESGFIFE